VVRRPGYSPYRTRGGFNEADQSTSLKPLICPRLLLRQCQWWWHKYPGQDIDSDTEVALDIQVAGSIAPSASILVFFAPNTEQDFAGDFGCRSFRGKGKYHLYKLGSAESTWSQMTAMNEAFQSAAAIGISVFVAAGDDGCNDNVGDGQVHVDSRPVLQR